MVRANEESETKSRRGKAVWMNRGSTAASKPLTSRLPYWLVMVDGVVQPIPERVAVVRKIVADFLAGTGQQRIAESLNQGGGQGVRLRGSLASQLRRQGPDLAGPHRNASPPRGGL